MSQFETVSISDDIELGSSRPLVGKTGGSSRSLRFAEGGLKEATIVWRNLDKFVDIDDGKNKKQILFNIGGVAKPGDMIALMGPSGSGKTKCRYLSNKHSAKTD